MTAAAESDRPVVAIYDSDCGFCTAAVDWVRRHDRHDRVGFVPIAGEVTIRGRSFHRPQIDERMHAVDSQGRVHRGFKAWRRIARELPAVRPLWPLLMLPGASIIGERVYMLVANNRTRISRRLGMRCRIEASCRASRR